MKRTVGLTLTALATLLIAGVAQAATFTVGNTNDSGPSSLRQAILDANAILGADTINFEIPTNVCTIILLSQLPVIDDELTIDGSGNCGRFTLSGNNSVRVMAVNGATLEVRNLIIANGSAPDGGGIFNYGGTLMVTNSFFYSNSGMNGGGIYSDSGTLNVTNSAFSANRASGSGGGGGIYISIGTVTVTNSTFSTNGAFAGGGIYNRFGTLSVTNSTFSDNGAFGGGGIYNSLFGTLTATNSTFFGNNSAIGGLYNRGTATLTNSIIANSYGGDCFLESGSLSADAFNIDGDGTCGAATTKSSAELGLQALAGNGGWTPTMSLGAGSAAIDAADDSVCPATDQRGVTRPQGSRCDVGAFEVERAEAVCPLPQGYWKDNPDAWPVDELTLGDEVYTKVDLLAILNTPVGSGKNADASIILAYQLIAAKLNIENGADASSVAATIEAANELLSQYVRRLPLGVAPRTEHGKLMTSYGGMLDAFNNSCAQTD